MDTNGLSLYHVGTSLDLDALSQIGTQNNNPVGSDDESDDGEEQEIQQRNAELQNLLTNAFDDLIEEDESDLETTNEDGGQYSSRVQPTLPQKEPDDSSKFLPSNNQYAGDSLYSPLHQGDLSETQYQNVDDLSLNNNSQYNSVSTLNHKKHCVRFSPIEEGKSTSYKSKWNQQSFEVSDKHYLSSGLNSQEELEMLYAARGSEITKLSAELHEMKHKVTLLEGEKTGLKVTVDASERILHESRNENRRFKDEIKTLNQKLDHLNKVNKDLSSKLEAAESNNMNLERQILDLNLFQSNHRDANRQEVLLNGIKARYENDLRTLRDELNRLRSELDHKNESLSNVERKLRDVTEMHERTLTERAANLQEFDRALNQQRQLREQRDTLTAATLLEELSKAKEEIEHLKAERISQTLSDSMAQMRLLPKDRDLKQRLDVSERTTQQLEETVRQLQKEKEILAQELTKSSDSSRVKNCEAEKLRSELSSVKELYLSVCKEKDLVEEKFHHLSNERLNLEDERKRLVMDLEDAKRQMEDNLNRHKDMIEANASSKLESAVKEGVARARLEWLKEKSFGQDDDQIHVEKSLGELQCLRETMDALRQERDILQNELTRRQQQLKTERHLLREKFTIEKDIINKNWQEKLSALSEKAEHNQSNSLITATADAMTRLRQQFEEEKLSIINNYEKQIIELQSIPSTPTMSSNASVSDWRFELNKFKTVLKNTKSIPPDTLVTLNSALNKAEASWSRDQNSLQHHVEKYKSLKRRVRDYQKYVNEKMNKCKAERQRSEDYCRQVISELLGKVTNELRQLECERRQPTNVGPTVSAPQPNVGSTFVQGIDELQRQVNRYVQGFTTLSK